MLLALQVRLHPLQKLRHSDEAARPLLLRVVDDDERGVRPAVRRGERERTLALLRLGVALVVAELLVDQAHGALTLEVGLRVQALVARNARRGDLRDEGDLRTRDDNSHRSLLGLISKAY